MDSKPELFVQMVIAAWNGQNKQVNKLIDSLPAENWKKQTAPGRNTGIYLLGHLAAVNDGIIVLLELGKRLRPEWEQIFIKNPDSAEGKKPTFEELKTGWKEINQHLEAGFSKMSTDDWFSRHTAVSPEDFIKEPHRNKLNILINRSNHQSYHVGQLVYLKDQDKNQD